VISFRKTQNPGFNSVPRSVSSDNLDHPVPAAPVPNLIDLQIVRDQINSMLASYTLYFVLALLIHELGHCVAARVCRVKIIEFGLGWGPKLFSFRTNGVDYGIRVLPIGAYVRLELAELLRQPLGRQVFVLLAGILANLLAAGLTDGTPFSLMNYLLAVTNILPLYQQDSWKCGILTLRGVFHRKSPLVEWTFTIAGSCLSFALFIALILVRIKSI
jgi:Peptidase family M50